MNGEETGSGPEKRSRIKISMQAEDTSGKSPRKPAMDAVTRLPEWDLLPPRGIVRRQRS